jgi:hypothetical protein
MAWHQALCNSTLLANDDQNEAFDMLRKVVQKFIVPKITKLCCIMDVFSASQTQNMQQLLQQLTFYFDESDKHIKVIFYIPALCYFI